MGTPGAFVGNQAYSQAYHPISNGLVKRFHYKLKDALKYQLALTNWVGSLPMTLLGIRTTLKDDLQCSAAEVVNGTILHAPEVVNGTILHAPEVVNGIILHVPDTPCT